ncbi:hypothetical protein JRQ81_002506 [Phrynocephalus forsythii]|uniref:Uncharacterized protein n=1 Tax=Phrynocephalus forsythii TaxID=171643 RepID=A0A9Q0XI41_9SAUR|nr:hypothetical protein JRQ81_002506 [Phrynocephalus forsythii]
MRGCNTLIWVISQWVQTSPRQKIFWCYPGRSQWFHDMVLQLWDDRQWLENFRMTRRTLFRVADKLRPYLMRRDTCDQPFQSKNELQSTCTSWPAVLVTEPSLWYSRKEVLLLQVLSSRFA